MAFAARRGGTTPGGRKKRKGLRPRLASDRPRNIILPSPKVDGSLRQQRGLTPSWGRVARTLSIASAEEALAALTPSAPIESPAPGPPGSKGVQKRKASQTPTAPDETTGSASYQQLVQEQKFLCDEVPHFQKVTEDIPMSRSNDVDAQTTFVFQLLKWILEYGKPAVHRVEVAQNELDQAQNDLEEHRDGVRTELARLELMVSELNLENQDLKDQLFSAKDDIAFYEEQIKEFNEHDDQEDFDALEYEHQYEEAAQQLEQTVSENESLKAEIVSLKQQLTDVRKSADELLEAYHGVIRERDSAVRELGQTRTRAQNMEQKYQKQMAHLDESHTKMQQELQTVVEEHEHKARIASPRVQHHGHGRQPSRIVQIATDYELNEQDMSMLEYSDGLQDGDFVSLQAEIDEYENSDDAWLSDSEDEYENNEFADEFLGAAVSPTFSPGFESVKVMHEQFAANPEELFEIVRTSTGVEAKQEEFGGGMMSMGVDLPEKEEFGSSTLMFGMDPTPTEEFGSGQISFGVDPKPQEEFGSGQLSFGVDAAPKEEFGSVSMSMGVDAPAKPNPEAEFGSVSMSTGVDAPPKPNPEAEFGSVSMSTGVDAPPKPNPEAEFGSVSLSMGVDAPPKPNPEAEFGRVSLSMGVDATPKEEFGSAKLSMGVEPEQKAPPEAEFEMVSTSTGVTDERVAKPPEKPPIELSLSTTTISVDAQKKKPAKLEFSTTVSTTTIPRDTGHFEMVRGPVQGLSPVSTPKAKPRSPHMSPVVKSRPPPAARITAINVPRGTDEIVTKGLNFKNLLSHFTTLETNNPGVPKWKRNKADELSNRWVVDGVRENEVKAKPTMAKASDPAPVVKITAKEGSIRSTATTPSAAGSQGTVQAKAIITNVVRTKFRTVKPKIKGYMHILKTTTLAPHIVSSSPNYFFCLDGLPASTNVDRSEPDWQKNRSKEPLAPCIFFFETESRYRDFVKVAGGLPVREMAFQKFFAEFALGIIPLEYRTVGTDENQCLQQLGRTLGKPIRLPVGMAEQTPATRTDPFLFIVGEGESHKFACSSVTERNQWLMQVTRLIRKRKETVANKRKVGYTHATPLPGLYKMPIILDESYTQEDVMD